MYQSKFKVGDRVVYMGTFADKYKNKEATIIGFGITGLPFVKFDDGVLYETTDEYLKLKVVENKFKIGDKVIYSGDDFSHHAFGTEMKISDGDEFEVVGDYIKYYSAVRGKNNFVSYIPEGRLQLKKEPKELQEGQEVWIKATFDEVDQDGDYWFIKEPTTSEYNYCTTKQSIYVKNDQGQIVPFEGE